MGRYLILEELLGFRHSISKKMAISGINIGATAEKTVRLRPTLILGKKHVNIVI